MRQQQRTCRELEDEQVREARLERMREHERTLRGEETLEAKAARLQHMREYLHSEKTSEARAARLERMTEHVLRITLHCKPKYVRSWTFFST